MTLLTKGMGAIIKKLGTISRNRASKKVFEKMKSGTSSREERLKHGVRDKTIKSVPVSKDVKAGDVKESIRKAKQHFYLKNIDEVNKHVENIKKGKKAEKGLKHMRDTKRAFKIGKTKTFPYNPAEGIGEFKKYNK